MFSLQETPCYRNKVIKCCKKNSLIMKMWIKTEEEKTLWIFRDCYCARAQLIIFEDKYFFRHNIREICILMPFEWSQQSIREGDSCYCFQICTRLLIQIELIFGEFDALLSVSISDLLVNLVHSIAIDNRSKSHESHRFWLIASENARFILLATNDGKTWNSTYTRWR